MKTIVAMLGLCAIESAVASAEQGAFAWGEWARRLDVVARPWTSLGWQCLQVSNDDSLDCRSRMVAYGSTAVLFSSQALGMSHLLPSQDRNVD